ncbi:MAG: SDR family NAD(P)-dependent oxidoreductase [Acidimicrobiia bacterium]|nr:SDR family NAD(P)-dependent oxidoreductase [Acidimicrobiia bacterium]
MEIAGSTILVTGASSGIGAELAPQLAARGATVGIVARRRDRLEQVLERCREHAPGSRAWVVDLSDLDAAEQVVRDAWQAFGHLDCLVNNAAMGKRKHVTDLTAAELDEVMRLDFASPVRMAMTALPRMLERGSGLIVNVGSPAGRFGIVHESAYCAAKFALSGWSEAAAMDLADTGVRVKLVLPGAIATEIWERRPGELPGLVEGPFTPADECAAGIIEAIESPAFEHYVPDLKDVVVHKTGDVEGFIEVMAAMARAAREARRI